MAPVVTGVVKVVVDNFAQNLLKSSLGKDDDLNYFGFEEDMEQNRRVDWPFPPKVNGRFDPFGFEENVSSEMLVPSYTQAFVERFSEPYFHPCSSKGNQIGLGKT